MKIIDSGAARPALARDRLHIVLIDSFYDMMEDPLASRLLADLFRFKVASYRQAYPYGIMPFGSSDLVGTHWVLCREEGDSRELKPIMGFKTIDASRAELFKLDFPALGLVSDPGLELHREAVLHELQAGREKRLNVAYGGSWTVDPELRKDPEASKLCRKITSAFIGHWMREYDLDTLITFAILKFQVDRFHSYLGMDRLVGPRGEYLPDFSPQPTFGESTSISVLRRGRVSAECERDMRDVADIWERRIVLASDRSPLSRTGAQPGRRLAA